MDIAEEIVVKAKEDYLCVVDRKREAPEESGKGKGTCRKRYLPEILSAGSGIRHVSGARRRKITE